MARIERFTFLVNSDERLLIERLAKTLQRSQSDAVRFVVNAAAKELARQDSQSAEIKGEPQPRRSVTQ
jgi:hypothetical protein